MTIPHTCHARGCDLVVPRKMLMCRRHWFMVPKNLQAAVWATYRTGQEVGAATPTLDWHRAADAAIAYVANREARHGNS